VRELDRVMSAARAGAGFGGELDDEEEAAGRGGAAALDEGALLKLREMLLSLDATLHSLPLSAAGGGGGGGGERRYVRGGEHMQVRRDRGLHSISARLGLKRRRAVF
jgi:hypothetical protein